MKVKSLTAVVRLIVNAVSIFLDRASNMVRRVVLDGGVGVLHVLVLLLTNLIWRDFSDFLPGILLISVEVVAAMFHLFYVVAYMNEGAWWGLDTTGHNAYKWIEYAITATTATVAVLYASERSDVGDAFVVLLVAAGVSQQSQGYIIENTPDSTGNVGIVSFMSALLIQIGEFVAVTLGTGDDAGDAWPVIAVYIVSYFMFGVLAAAVRWPLWNGQMLDKNKAEKVYSILGAISKIGIYVAEFIYLHDKHAVNDLARDMLYAWVVVVAVAIVGLGIYTNQLYAS